MIKKCILITVLMFGGLGNSLNGMQQNQSLWGKFTSWLRSPRVDYVERWVRNQPSGPVYPYAKEQELFKELALPGEDPDEVAKRLRSNLSSRGLYFYPAGSPQTMREWDQHAARLEKEIPRTEEVMKALLKDEQNKWWWQRDSKKIEYYTNVLERGIPAGRIRHDLLQEARPKFEERLEAKKKFSEDYQKILHKEKSFARKPDAAYGE